MWKQILINSKCGNSELKTCNSSTCPWILSLQLWSFCWRYICKRPGAVTLIFHSSIKPHHSPSLCNKPCCESYENNRLEHIERDLAFRSMSVEAQQYTKTSPWQIEIHQAYPMVGTARMEYMAYARCIDGMDVFLLNLRIFK